MPDDVYAQLPTGEYLQFPNGTDPAVIQRVVKQHLGVKPAATPPAPPVSKVDRAAVDKFRLNYFNTNNPTANVPMQAATALAKNPQDGYWLKRLQQMSPVSQQAIMEKADEFAQESHQRTLQETIGQPAAVMASMMTPGHNLPPVTIDDRNQQKITTHKPSELIANVLHGPEGARQLQRRTGAKAEATRMAESVLDPENIAAAAALGGIANMGPAASSLVRKGIAVLGAYQGYNKIKEGDLGGGLLDIGAGLIPEAVHKVTERIASGQEAKAAQAELQARAETVPKRKLVESTPLPRTGTQPVLPDVIEKHVEAKAHPSSADILHERMETKPTPKIPKKPLSHVEFDPVRAIELGEKPTRPTKETQGAVQEQGANAGVLRPEQPKLGLSQVGEGNAEPQETAGGEARSAPDEAGAAQAPQRPRVDPRSKTRGAYTFGAKPGSPADRWNKFVEDVYTRSKAAGVKTFDDLKAWAASEEPTLSASGLKMLHTDIGQYSASLTKGSTVAAAAATAPPLDKPTQNLVDKIGEAYKQRPVTDKAFSAERGRRLGASESAMKGVTTEAEFDRARGLHKGPLPGADFQPLQMDQADVDSMVKRIAQYPYWDKTPFKRFTAKRALEKIITEGRVPARVELDALREVFGPEIEKSIIKARPKEGPLDWINAWHRFAILSSLTSLGKLGVAAATRMVTTPLEELNGIYLPESLKTAAPREGHFNVKAEVQALKGGLGKAMTGDPGVLADMRDKLIKGEHSLDRAYHPGDPESISPILGLFRRIHGSIKTPAQRAEFFRGFEKRATAYARQGLDITDPQMQLKIGAEAYADSKRAILMQDNFVVDEFNNMLSKMAKHGIAGKVARFGTRIAMPIVRIPTNFVAEAGQYAGGIPMAAAKLAQGKFRAIGELGLEKPDLKISAFNATVAKIIKARAVDQLSPDEADFVVRAFKKNGIGMGLFALGYLQPNGLKMPGEYVPNQHIPKDEKFGYAYYHGVAIPSYLLHSPAMMMLQFGATARRVHDQKGRKADTGAGEQARQIATSAAENIPFIHEASAITQAGESGPKLQRMEGDEARSILIPAMIQQIAQWQDKNKADSAYYRKAENMKQELKLGIPGLREQVPLKRKGRR